MFMVEDSRRDVIMATVVLPCLIYFVVTCRAIKIGILSDERSEGRISQEAVMEAVTKNPIFASGEEFENGKPSLQLLWRQLNVSNGLFALEVCSLFENGIHVLVSILRCRPRQYILSHVDVLYVPHVAISLETCESPVKSHYSVYMKPRPSSQNAVVRDILRRMDWNSVGLIFDDSVDSIQRRDLVFELSSIMIESTITTIYSTHTNVTSETHDSVARLKSSGLQNFIVIGTTRTLKSITMVAQDFDLFARKYYWVVMVDDLTPSDVDIIFRPRLKSNILLARRSWSGSLLCIDSHCGSTHCLCESDCTGRFCSLSLLEATLADAIRIIYRSSTVLDKDALEDVSITCFSSGNRTFSQGGKLISAIKQTNIESYTNIHGFDASGQPRVTDYELFSVFNTSTGPLQLVGSWSSTKGLQADEKVFLNKFHNFGHRTIKVATLESLPFCIESTENNKTFFRGFAFDILNELAFRLKFNYTITQPSDRLYGAPNNDGTDTWNGMVGMVRRGEVDIAVGPFTITSMRESVIDFTKPYLEDSTGILTRKPQDEDSKIFQMFKPYSGPVWGAIAAAILLVGVVSFLVNYYTPYSGMRLGVEDCTPDELSFKENMWLIYSSAMEQGATYHPNAISGRCVLGFFWIFTIVIVATYTANLAAFLTVSVPYIPINSLGELMTQTEVQPVVKDGTNLWSMFQSSKRGIYVDVWKRIQQSPRATVTEDALELVKTGKYAYMSDTALLRYIAISDCSFAVANEVFNTAGYGFVMPENAAFEDAFNYNIMKMQEAGLIEKWRQKWWSTNDQCDSGDRTGSATSLGLDSLGGAFLVYLAVAGVSIVCLALEIVGNYTGIVSGLRQKVMKPKVKRNGFHHNGI